MDCRKCDHLYYDSGGAGHCDMPYENICLKLLHKWHTDPDLFVEEILDIKLMPYQKHLLKFFMKNNKSQSFRNITKIIPRGR